MRGWGRGYGGCKKKDEGRRMKAEVGTRKFHAETRRRFFGGILRLSGSHRRDTSEPFLVYLGHLPFFLSSAPPRLRVKIFVAFCAFRDYPLS
jgi:hypothetical protein